MDANCDANDASARFAALSDNGSAPKNGGARRDRTDDLKLAKLPLSQLSYGPDLCGMHARLLPRPNTLKGVVGLGRFELPTSRLSSARSNQLSYRPSGADAL